MEKKLLVIFTITLCAATGIEAARVVTVPRSGSKMQKLTKPSKHEAAMDAINHLYDDTLEAITLRLDAMESKGLHLCTADYEGLITNFTILKSELRKARMGQARLINNNAQYLYTTVEKAFNQIKGMASMPGHSFKVAGHLVNEVAGMIAMSYIKTMKKIDADNIDCKTGKPMSLTGRPTK